MMKLKYLTIIAVVAIVNVLNTNVAVADLIITPEEIIMPIVCPLLITTIAIIIGIYGITYVKEKQNKKTKNNDSDN